MSRNVTAQGGLQAGHVYVSRVLAWLSAGTARPMSTLACLQREGTMPKVPCHLGLAAGCEPNAAAWLWEATSRAVPGLAA